jgi:hypothetical protein
MDLFEPVVHRTRMHRNFIHAMERATEHDRAVLDTWARGFFDRDGKFVRELQTTFNSSFWELYLFACLKELGLVVDFSHEAPDFVVPSGPLPLVIEATTAHNAIGDPAESSLTPDEFMALDREPVVDKATIRLAGALRAKHQKYLERYSTLEHVKGLPFLVAIAPFEQPGFFVQNDQAMGRVLYAYNKPVVEFDQGSPFANFIRHDYMPWINKPNGAEIELGFFTRLEMREISAVVFTNLATWSKVRALSEDPNPYVYFETLRFDQHTNKPHHEITPKRDYSEPLLDGLHIFHNPYADIPLDHTFFRGRPVAQYFYPPGEDAPWCEAPDRHLIQRTTLTFAPEEDPRT